MSFATQTMLRGVERQGPQVPTDASAFSMTGVIDYKNGSQVDSVAAYLRTGLATSALQPVPDKMNDSGRFNLDIDKSGTVVDMGYHRKGDENYPGATGHQVSSTARADTFDLEETAGRIGRELATGSHAPTAHDTTQRSVRAHVPLQRSAPKTITRSHPASDEMHEGLNNHRDALNAMSKSIKGIEQRLETSESQASRVKSLSRDVVKCESKMGQMHDGLMAHTGIMQRQNTNITQINKTLKSTSSAVSMMHDGLTNHKTVLSAMKVNASQHARDTASTRSDIDRAMAKVNQVHTGLMEQKSTVSGLHSGVMAHKDLLKTLHTSAREDRESIRQLRSSCASDKIDVTSKQMQSMLQKRVQARV